MVSIMIMTVGEEYLKMIINNIYCYINYNMEKYILAEKNIVNLLEQIIETYNRNYLVEGPGKKVAKKVVKKTFGSQFKKGFSDEMLNMSEKLGNKAAKSLVYIVIIVILVIILSLLVNSCEPDYKSSGVKIKSNSDDDTEIENVEFF